MNAIGERYPELIVGALLLNRADEVFWSAPQPNVIVPKHSEETFTPVLPSSLYSIIISFREIGDLRLETSSHAFPNPI